MPAKQSIGRGKAKTIGWREAKARANEMLPAHFLEEVPAGEDVAQLGQMCRIAHPVVLDLSQALAADRRGAEILPGVLLRRLGLLDECVDCNTDRRLGDVGAVEIEHGLHSSQ